MLPGICSHSYDIPSVPTISSWYRELFHQTTRVHPHKSDYCKYCARTEKKVKSIKEQIQKITMVFEENIHISNAPDRIIFLEFRNAHHRKKSGFGGFKEQHEYAECKS